MIQYNLKGFIGLNSIHQDMFFNVIHYLNIWWCPWSTTFHWNWKYSLTSVVLCEVFSLLSDLHLLIASQQESEIASSNTNNSEAEQDNTNKEEYEVSDTDDDDPLWLGYLCLLVVEVVVDVVDNCDAQAAQESLRLHALHTSTSPSSLDTLRLDISNDGKPGRIMIAGL